MSQAKDHSWSEEVPYLCVCGTTYPVIRQRWVDRDAQAELHARILIDGPLRGHCPMCGTEALGRTTWLEVIPSEKRATLVLGASQRAGIIDALKAHLDSIAHRGHALPAWMLQPQLRFEGGRASTGASQASSVEFADDSDPGQPLVSLEPETAPELSEPEAGVPKPVGTRRSMSKTSASEDGHVAPLVLEGDKPTVTVVMTDAVRSQWGKAALRAVPVHLREHGYPLVGVRVVASYLGASSVVDAVIDVADEQVNEIFTALSSNFSIRLRMTDESGATPVSREVGSETLGRNAALCLESARGVLASEEFPPSAFEDAWAALAEQSCRERLIPAPQPLAPGDYMHLLTPRESWLALAALDAASDKPNLAHLLEVDGLPIAEFEAIRKRVLAGALEHGLCAPRRFWRRVIASGLAADAAHYARRLATERATWEREEDDLDETQQQEAWEKIRELCVRRDLPFPEELMEALGLEEAAPRTPRGHGSKAAAGEIEVSGEVPARRPPRRADGGPSLEARVPLMHAVEGLGEAGDEVTLSAAFAALDEAGHADLLALLPTLVTFGNQAIPNLLSRLDSPRREVRQAAVALLSLNPDGASIRPLVKRLYDERSKVWTDVARALGSFGPRALGPVTAVIRDRPPPRPGDEGVLRAARAMAEVAVSDAGGGSAQDAVEALVDAPHRGVARAASRALATLHDVRLAKAQVLGQAPMPEVTVVRGFSRQIMDALGLSESRLDAAPPAEAPRAKPNAGNKTQVIGIDELMELREADEGVTELDPEELESV